MFEPKTFDHLIGTAGFSETLLKNHFTLYQGYVTNTNKLADTLAALLREGTTATPEYAELKRRFGWEYNGMRLHELYFANMNKAPELTPVVGDFKAVVEKSFGSEDAWLKDFKASGTMRGIGWVLLMLDPIEKRLFNIWVNEHDLGHLAGCSPLLVLDVFEHAYMLDYGLKKADYLEAFLRAVDWQVVSARFNAAMRNV